MNEPIKGTRISASSGTEYSYILTVRPGGAEIWAARIYHQSRLVCVLARGLLQRDLEADHLDEHVRSLVLSYIDSLP